MIFHNWDKISRKTILISNKKIKIWTGIDVLKRQMVNMLESSETEINLQNKEQVRDNEEKHLQSASASIMFVNCLFVYTDTLMIVNVSLSDIWISVGLLNIFTNK